jgi:hypothetical protein
MTAHDTPEFECDERPRIWRQSQSSPRTDFTPSPCPTCNAPYLSREREEPAPIQSSGQRSTFAVWWEATRETRGLVLFLLILCLLALAALTYLDSTMQPVIEGVRR